MNVVRTKRLLCFIFSLSIFSQNNAKILRHGNHFDAAFTILTSGTKLLPKFVIRNHTDVDINKCVEKCIYEPKCESLNHNNGKRLCEILNASSSAAEHRSTFKIGWIHYETDSGAKKVGPYCQSMSPCEDTHVCEDTFSSPAFKCYCQDGFTGDNCKTFNGPGSAKSSPAASCILLSRIYKSLRNGYYWFKSRDNTAKYLFCNIRREDGLGESAEAAIKDCNWLHRNYPEFENGYYWKWNSSLEASKKCYCDKIHGEIDRYALLSNLYDDVQLKLINSTAPITKGKYITTIEKLSKEYLLRFNLTISSTHDKRSNILHLTTGRWSDKKRYNQFPLVTLTGNVMKICSNLYYRNVVYCINIEINFNEWMDIEIAQVQFKGEYIYVVHVNGDIIDVARNVKAREIYGVNIYCSNPWRKSVNGEIRNLYLYGTHSKWDGNELRLFRQERIIVRNTLFATLSEIGMEYKIEFDVKPTNLQAHGNLKNILDFQNENGTNVISVSINNDKKLNVTIEDGIYISKTSFDNDEWKSVGISQANTNDGYISKIMFQNETLLPKVKLNPTRYKNVKVYISNNQNEQLDGYIRKLSIFGNHIYWKGNRLNLINSAMNITGTKLIRSLTKMGQEYKVKLDVVVMNNLKYSDSFVNIIFFFGDDRYRYPTIYYSSSYFHISSLINDNLHHNYNDFEHFKLHKWVSIDVSQIKNEDGNFKYTIKIDGEEVHTTINEKPKRFSDVKVYVMFKGSTMFPIRIRRFELYGDFEV